MEPESPDSPLLDGRAQLTHVNVSLVRWQSFRSYTRVQGYGAVSDSGMELMPKKKKSCYHRVAARVTLLPYSVGLSFFWLPSHPHGQILVPLCVYAVFLAGCLQVNGSRELLVCVHAANIWGSYVILSCLWV